MKGVSASNLQQFFRRLVRLNHEHRVKLATEAIAKAIAFYSDFLEQQERYQQETPEQREAEKAWIDQQRQELAQVRDRIEVIPELIH